MNWIPVSELPPDDFLDRRYIIWVSDGKWSHWNRGYFNPIDKTWAAPLFASEEKTVTHWCEIAPPATQQPPLTPEQVEEFRRELDTTPIDWTWALSAGFTPDPNEPGMLCIDKVWLIFDEQRQRCLSVYVDGFRIHGPTIGQVRTVLRMANITLTEKNNAQQ